MTEQVLVIGASSAIARAIIDAELSQDNTAVTAISRNIDDFQTHPNLTVLSTDYSEQSIAAHADQLVKEGEAPVRVYVCNGMLHSAEVFPEKQLQEFRREQWLDVMTTNALIPMSWLQAIIVRLPAKHTATITLFSARVGSISDNRLGGWYSYRSSKAALNMLVKNVALECKRTHPNLSLMLFHPGTTDTPLSEPFQKRVPPEKLFTPAFVAEKLLSLISEKPATGNLRYIDWAGDDIDW